MFTDSITPVQCLLKRIEEAAHQDAAHRRAHIFLLACLLGGARGVYKDAHVPAQCLSVLLQAGNDVAHMRRVFYRGSSLKSAEQHSTFQCYANSLQRCSLLLLKPASLQVEMAMFDTLVRATGATQKQGAGGPTRAA